MIFQKMKSNIFGPQDSSWSIKNVLILDNCINLRNKIFHLTLNRENNTYETSQQCFTKHFLQDIRENNSIRNNIFSLLQKSSISCTSAENQLIKEISNFIRKHFFVAIKHYYTIVKFSGTKIVDISLDTKILRVRNYHFVFLVQFVQRIVFIYAIFD